MPKRNYITPEILQDTPLSTSEQLEFNFDHYAITLARLIASKKTKTPLTICVSGNWGSGKTTLLRRVQAMLPKTNKSGKASSKLEFANVKENSQKEYRKCRTVWFNAWKYSDEDELLVALIRTILQEMSEDTIVNKVLGKLVDPTYPRRDIVNTVLQWFKIKLPGDLEIGLNTGVPIPTQLSEKTAILDLFDSAFDRLMAVWVHRKLNVLKINPQNGILVVFIDDLDRCLPAKMVQVLEAIKLFLDKRGCIFVLGADTTIVQQAITKHYENEGVTGENAREYLNKIVQLRFDLPSIIELGMEKFLKKEGVIRKDWGDSWKLLIKGANFNPRAVKSFVNDINLRWSILVNLGLAKEVNRSDFNAWQVLMRIAPESFIEHISLVSYEPRQRYDYVINAIRWAREDSDTDEKYKTYKTYQEKYKFRRVLREISFSTSFSPVALDAFFHLLAPAINPLLKSKESIDDRIAAGLSRLRVLISYAVEDKEGIEPLVQNLKANDIDVWLDTEQLTLGDEWEQIQHAMQVSDAIIVCISKAGQLSGYWNKQLYFASDLALEKPEGIIFLIPVRLEDCDVPRKLKHLQWVDLFGDTGEGYTRLVKSLQIRAESIGLRRQTESQ
jgi:KAP-like P-loop domain-containing protein/TIR domain-containing protein